MGWFTCKNGFPALTTVNLPLHMAAVAGAEQRWPISEGTWVVLVPVPSPVIVFLTWGSESPLFIIGHLPGSGGLWVLRPMAPVALTHLRSAEAHCSGARVGVRRGRFHGGCRILAALGKADSSPKGKSISKAIGNRTIIFNMEILKAVLSNEQALRIH